MTFLELMDYLQKNGGATIKINDVDDYFIYNHEYGYQVARRGIISGLYFENVVATEIILDLKTEFDKIVGFFLTTKNGDIGLWVDDNKLYIDTLSQWFTVKSTALEIAKNEGQKAIWDWSKKETIYL